MYTDVDGRALCMFQVYLCDHLIRLQQMDVHARVLQLPLPLVRHHDPSNRSVRIGLCNSKDMALSPSQGEAEQIRLFVRHLEDRQVIPCADEISGHSTKVIPTAITTGLDIGLSNLSLKTVTLTLYSQSGPSRIDLSTY